MPPNRLAIRSSDLLLGGVGEGVAVEEGEVAADLGGELGGGDRAIPARGGRCGARSAASRGTRRCPGHRARQTRRAVAASP